MSEVQLRSSHLWRQQQLKLFMVEAGGSEVSTELLEYLLGRINQSSLPIAIVKVVCEGDGNAGVEESVCPLMARHSALVKIGGGASDVVGLEHSRLHGDKLQSFIAILEEMIGGGLSHAPSHASLMAAIAKHQESFLAVATQKTTEYAVLLESYLVHSLPLPLLVVSSKEFLPLRRRPRHTAKAMPLYVFNLRGYGREWYQLFKLDEVDTFINRSRYPAVVDFGDHRNIFQEFRNKGMHLALFFPGLPRASRMDFEELVTAVAENAYLSYIVIVAERERDHELAKQHFLTDDTPLPRVILLPWGIDKNMVTFDITGDDLYEEVFELLNLMMSVAQQESNVMEVLHEGEGDKVPSLSITDLFGIQLLVERNKNDMVVSFCKNGTERCPDDLYFALDDARMVVLKAKLNVTYHFFVVECESAADLPFKLKSLPGYALYNSSKRHWTPGAGNVQYFKDIVALIAQETGQWDILDISIPDETADTDYYPPDFHFNFPNRKKDDVYGMLSQTLPSLPLPDSLIFTADNFDEKIALAEKTAVVFYIGWSSETKLLLHHLRAAWERLDRSKSVGLGSVDCHAHTRTCSRFNATCLPSVLLFTSPSSSSSPSPVASPMGVIDDTHLLLALGQEVEPQQDHAQLSEVTPASLPVLLRHTLATPLVLWCSDSPTSKLTKAFAQTVQDNSEKYSEFAFAWLNSAKNWRLLEVAFSLKGQKFPAVFAVRFAQRAVYKMEEIQLLPPATFRERLIEFLEFLKDGSLSPTSQLSRKEWPPLQPPFTFPSNTKMDGSGGLESQREEEEEEEEFDDIGKLDISSIPYDEAPQFHDNYHSSRDEL